MKKKQENLLSFVLQFDTNIQCVEYIVMESGIMIRYNLNYFFKAPIDINNKLSAFTVAMLESDFQNMVSTPALIVYKNNQNDQITINPIQFTFELERQFSLTELSSTLPYVQNAINAFSSDIRGISISFADIKRLPLEVASSLDATKNITDFEINGECFTDVTGIGLRLISGRGENGLYNEFKCEPFLRDPRFLYFESVNNYEYSVEFNIIDECSKIYEAFEVKRDFLFTKIIC